MGKSVFFMLDYMVRQKGIEMGNIFVEKQGCTPEDQIGFIDMKRAEFYFKAYQKSGNKEYLRQAEAICKTRLPTGPVKSIVYSPQQFESGFLRKYKKSN